ncbi:MAG: PaaI family thioesterase [Actinomycetota bacterium]
MNEAEVTIDGERRESLERMFNERAPIAKTFGMRLSYDDHGRALLRLPYNPALDHAGHGVHGGVLMTMLDNAGWFTCALAYESGLVLTSEFTVHLLRPASQATLIATAEIIKAGRRQNVAEMRCRDDLGNLVAHAVGTFVNVDSGERNRSVSLRE